MSSKDQILTRWRLKPECPVVLCAVALIIIILAGFGLRFHELGNDSLWVDEIGQVRVASYDLPGVLNGVIRHHGAAPIDYVLLHFWLKVGRGDFWVRALAAI